MGCFVLLLLSGKSTICKLQYKNVAENYNKTYPHGGGPRSVMVTLLTLKQEVRGSNPGAAHQVWSPSPLGPIPRLQVGIIMQRCNKGPWKGWCTRKPSTRDDKKPYPHDFALLSKQNIISRGLAFVKIAEGFLPNYQNQSFKFFAAVPLLSSPAINKNRLCSKTCGCNNISFKK